MSKAVLKMSMPEACRFCRLRYDYRCFADGGRRIMDKSTKPDWCPLRLLPDRKPPMQFIGETPSKEQYTEYDKGWNACLDAITGGE